MHLCRPLFDPRHLRSLASRRLISDGGLAIGWHLARILAAALLLAGPARAACDIKRIDIPVRFVDRQPIASVELDGKAAQLVVDSSAVISTLRPETAAAFGLTVRSLPNGAVHQTFQGGRFKQVTTVARLGLRGDELPEVAFLVGSDGLGQDIQGVLGRNVLSLADTEYDFANGMVRLTFPQGDCGSVRSLPWAADVQSFSVPLLPDPVQGGVPAVRVSAKLNEKPLQAQLHTNSVAALSSNAAVDAGIRTAQLIGRSDAFGSGKTQRFIAPVARFELGTERLIDVAMPVEAAARYEIDLILGTDYFLSHHLYVSRLTGTLHVRPNGATVFPPAYSSPDPGVPRLRGAMPSDAAHDDADALARRGAAAVAMLDLPRAVADLSRAITLAPTVAIYRFDRARAHVAAGEASAALADLDEALRLDPSLADARYRRAAQRERSGDAAGALADLDRLDSTLPKAAPIRKSMGRVYKRLGRTDRARQQVTLWLETHPDDADRADALNERCWSRVIAREELTQALADCEAAVAADPRDPNAWDSLGWTRLRLNQLSAARQAFDQALALARIAVSFHGRSVVRARLDDAAGAAEDRAAALKVDPDVDQRLRRDGLDER